MEKPPASKQMPTIKPQEEKPQEGGPQKEEPQEGEPQKEKLQEAEPQDPEPMEESNAAD